jgi:hypothetical protein
MLIMVGNFFPLRKLAINGALASQSPDASVVLVDDSIWSIFSQEISERQTKVAPDSLTFSGPGRASFGDFGIKLNTIFGLFNVIETQGS